MRIITLANNKGGVTKTTTTVNLAYGLARAGKRVLVIDTDAQSNATYSLLGTLIEDNTLFDVLVNGAPLVGTVVETKQKGLHLVPSSIDLSAADIIIGQMTGREQRLKKALAPVAPNYDFVLIDTPPNLGVITVNAFVACTDVIIPIALTTYALIGIAILEKTMQELRDNLDNVILPVLGVIANLDDHTRMGADVLSAVKEHFGDLVFSTIVPRNIKVEEAHNQIASLFDYAPNSTGAKAYTQLVEEVIARVERG